MFKDNKYTKWYMTIVSHAQARDASTLRTVERHHIVPGSLGGSKAKKNMVQLTPREHLICHRLLTRMVEGEAKRKMMWALHLMLFSENPHQERVKVTARVYENFREEFYSSVRGVPRLITAEHRANIAAANTKRLKGKKLSAGWCAKLAESRVGEKNGMYGRKHSPESIAKMKANRAGKGPKVLARSSRA